jgi:hypothetical protein
MKSPRPPRWQRKVDRTRAWGRRTFKWVALIGLLVGLFALPLVNVDDDIEGLIRLAMVLPAAVFVLWWMFFPGIALDKEYQPVPAEDLVDVQARIDQIEQTFDAATFPRATRRSVTPVDAATATDFRGSIRRDGAASPEDVAKWGIRREAFIERMQRARTADQG